MKATIGGVLVLRLAGRAHAERRHGRHRAVVGDVLNDGVARAAIGAVGEGIAKAPIRGIAEVAPAIVAGRHVGRHQHELAGFGHAVPDDEVRIAQRREIGDSELLDLRQRRRLIAQRREEFLQRRSPPPSISTVTPGRGVQHIAHQSKRTREVVDKRPEAHALHDAAYPNQFADAI